MRPPNTFDAHRVLHLARERGVKPAVKERLRAYFTEGESLGDPDTLARIGAEAGLDGGEVRRVLAGDGYAGAVRADEEEAAPRTPGSTRSRSSRSRASTRSAGASRWTSCTTRS